VVANADGSGERVLLAKKVPETIAAGFFIGPSWSPDGRLIAMPLRRSGSWTPIAVDVQSGKEQPLSKDRWVSLGQLAWTRDGRRLLLVNPRPTIQRLFALTGADGTLNVVFD